MEPKDKVIFIIGPTAVGKTAFSIALACKISGEIISSDSMQAYRHMNILSQKPLHEERKAVPHHLIDILEPQDEYSAARFVKLAKDAVDGILRRRHIPIVVGGSGLYVKALIDGLFPAPAKDAAFRSQLQLKAGKNGIASLHAELENIDPDAARAIHPNDARRIIRALEIFHQTGVPISKQKEKTKGIKEDYDIRIFGLSRPRKALCERIDERVEKMFADGLADEVKSLKKKKPSMTAAASVGYKELIGFLEGGLSGDEAKELLKKNTRRLAKKQMTWFNADKRITWIDLDRTPESEAIQLIINSCREQLRLLPAERTV